jgi:hypothetical protein
VADSTGTAVIQQAGKLTDKQTDSMTGKQAGNRTSKQADKRLGIGEQANARKEREVAANNESDRAGLLEARIGAAEQLAKSSSITVTVRIPKALNEWLDEYVHGSWPERVLKQGLVIEALKLLYARRGRPGERVLETELVKEPSHD